MTGEEVAADWGQADLPVQPRLVDPAGAAPKALDARAEVEEGEQQKEGGPAEGGRQREAGAAWWAAGKLGNGVAACACAYPTPESQHQV